MSGTRATKELALAPLVVALGIAAMGAELRCAESQARPDGIGLPGRVSENAARISANESAISALRDVLDELSALPTRVDAIDEDLATAEGRLGEHEERLVLLEQGGRGLEVVDADGQVVGGVIPGTLSGFSARVLRDSGSYTVSESGFHLSRSLIYRDASCAGPLLTVDDDFPIEGGGFSPVEQANAMPDGRAYVKALVSVGEEEGVATVQLFIPDGNGGCQTWFAADASRVHRLILRDDLTLFHSPFSIVVKSLRGIE